MFVLAGCGGSPAAPEASPGVRSTNEVLSVEPWEFNGRPGRIIRTHWHRIYTTETDPALTDRLPAFLERALDHYTTALGPLPRPPMKLDTFLMSTRPQWAELTWRLMGDQAPTFLRIQRGGFASGGRAVLWSIGPHDTLSIAAHEGWHQYTQRTFRDWLPVWLEEGVATYMEGFVTDPGDPFRPLFSGWANVERFDQLRQSSAQGELLPLGALLSSNPQELIHATTTGTLTYYAQVWALVHFLHEERRDGLRTLLADGAAGRMALALELRLGKAAAVEALRTRQGDAIYRVYFGDPAADAPEYTRFIAKLVETGSRDRIVAGRSPFER